MRAGLDVVSDGEQSRFDFNLSFYAFLEGLEPEREPRRRFGPPAHDQRGRHRPVGELRAPRGLDVVEEYERLRELAPAGPELKTAVPGPYTLAGRIVPGGDYPDRWAVAEALAPAVRDELVRLVAAGCGHVQVDEPSMSCYAYREDTARLVDLSNRTGARRRPLLPGHAPLLRQLQGARGREAHVRPDAARLPRPGSRRGTPGDGQPRASGARADRALRRAPRRRGRRRRREELLPGDPADVEERIRRCLEHVPPERLAVAPDCGLSQTARWAARAKLEALVEGTRRVRASL